MAIAMRPTDDKYAAQCMADLITPRRLSDLRQLADKIGMDVYVLACDYFGQPVQVEALTKRAAWGFLRWLESPTPEAAHYAIH